ncbi:MAG: acyl-CoA thioester hydrolase/BAAT C-terminal domain-containing protein [Sphingomonadaceae bacterium]|nr:acyl-CoA thioester hydrolase/BAAT C-terminal domain-containing protein [Sphingomonadaceae bacterium]
MREWLKAQPEADANRIGLWGASKGAEFALIAASRYDWVKAVVAVVPSDVVWEGWGGSGPATASFAFDGRPLAFEPYVGMDAELAKVAKGEPMDLFAGSTWRGAPPIPTVWMPHASRSSGFTAHCC